jgi:uncharacterized membrane protein
MKKQTITNALVILFAISPAVYLFLIWDTIPETFVTRFKLTTTVEEAKNKDSLMIATLIISVSSALLYVLMRNLHKVDPKVSVDTPKTIFNRLALVISVFMTIGNYMFIISVQTNSTININVIFAAVGLFITVAGNYMNNLKPNYVAGIRLPWTLNDPDNWRKTHQFASKLWFFGGFVLIIVSLVSPGNLMMPLFIGVVLVLTIVPGVYSYTIFRSKSQL